MNLEYPLDQKFFAYQQLEIIKCKDSRIILIACNPHQEKYAAIVFDKVKITHQSLPLSEIFVQINQKSSYDQIKSQIFKVSGPFHTKQSIKAYGIVGFHKFLQGHYLTYISQIQVVARFGKHKIYTIKNTDILPLFQMQSDRKMRKNQEKYLQILGQFKLQNFYFSYTYDLSNSLALNMIRNSKKIFQFEPKNQISMSQNKRSQNFIQSSQIFTFNYDLIKEFHSSLQNKKFVIPIVHGYCKQINVQVKSTIFNIIVIARRSRHHAGTRYIKRGISSHGFVANFVQIEQIVINHSSSQDSRPVCSSFIQVRGSVPTYWFQRPSIHIPKPAIQSKKFIKMKVKNDDYMFLATRKHFYDMMCRYGSQIYAVNLMKMRQKVPRQSLLSKEYQTALSFINKQDLKGEGEIHYIEIDMKYNLRLDKKLFVTKMKTIAYYAIQNTGIFMCQNPSTSSHEQFIQFQNGIVRANCVDCLDRTNSFQQLVGQTALAIQLNRLLKQTVTFDSLQLSDKILSEYSKLYEQMGDLISIQYGSSLAHKQKIQKSTESRFQFLIAITRHVNNNWNDYERQRQMDVFLGFTPDPNSTQIWDQKPTISHYPSRDLQKFQNSDWSSEALQKFIERHQINNFFKMSKKQSYERNISKIEKFIKEDLASKFNVEIVNSLVSERQSIQLYQFYVTPKPNYVKLFWPLKNYSGRKIQTLKEQLQFCYNKMDFIKNPQTKSLSSQKQIKTDASTESQNLSSNKKFKSPASFYFDEKLTSSINMKLSQKLIDLDNYFDESQNKMLEKYMLGELIEDNQIQQELQNFNAFLNSQVDIDWPSEFQIQKELKFFASNMSNKNYINFSQVNQMTQLLRKKKKTFIQNSSAKITKNLQLKNQKIKQNKILILQQIMKKNFSHGNIQKIEQI